MIGKTLFDAMRAMPVCKPEMRKANRDGLKKQTRRVMDPQPWEIKGNKSYDRIQELMGKLVIEDQGLGYFKIKEKFPSPSDGPVHTRIIKCPYGAVDDFCYMREPLVRGFGDVAYYKDDGVMVRDFLKGEPITWRWKKDVLTSIFMPKEAARSIYQYASIDVERVQEISRDDAKAEGVSGVWKNPPEKGEHYSRVMLNPYVANYSVLWDEINAERGYPWDSNPWVWVLGYVPVMYLTSWNVGSEIDGLHADLIIMDDPMKDESFSDEARKAFENMVRQNFINGMNINIKAIGIVPWRIDPDKKGGVR